MYLKNFNFFGNCLKTRYKKKRSIYFYQETNYIFECLIESFVSIYYDWSYWNIIFQFAKFNRFNGIKYY